MSKSPYHDVPLSYKGLGTINPGVSDAPGGRGKGESSVEEDVNCKLEPKSSLCIKCPRNAISAIGRKGGIPL
jgi:hypothetical protein